MSKNKQATLIASIKMLNIGFINKHITNLGIVVGFLVLVNYQSLVSKFFPLAPLPIILCLIVFGLKRFICITHCETLIPSCYIALSYLFAKA